MKKNIIKYYMAMVCSVLMVLSSCNDLDLAPTNAFTDLNYWKTTEQASAVLSMAYSQMFGANYFFANERLTDNLYEDRGTSDEKSIVNGLANAATNRFSEEWKHCFEGIKSCHTFLENVDRVPNMDEKLRDRMKAEARYIRASLFFRLACHYGDVPFFTQSLTQQEANTIGRTPKADVVAFVRKELNEVAAILPTKQQYEKKDNGRITSAAAMTLLARTYLYENNWSEVSTICRKIMNGDYGIYGLFPSYEGLFLPENEYNEEVILDLGYVNELRTWSEFYDAIPLTVGGRISGFAPTQELVESYLMKNGKAISASDSGYDEENPYVNRDPRFAATIVYHGYQWKSGSGVVSTIYIKPGSAEEAGASNLDEYAGPGTNSTATGYYLRKYFDPTAPQGMAAGLNLILMRYADILLMYAEAMFEQGNMNEAVWNETIYEIRKRAGFTDISALEYPGTADMREIIRRERRCELAVEGLRLFDIRRWGTIEQVLNMSPRGAKYGANGAYIQLDARKFDPQRDYLFAIPQSQRDINGNLTQNNGY